MPQKIVATLHENYNGWSVEVDGEDVTEDSYDTIVGTLVDITVDDADENGFVYDFNEKECMAALHEFFGSDAEITIEVDSFST